MESTTLYWVDRGLRIHALQDGPVCEFTPSRTQWKHTNERQRELVPAQLSICMGRSKTCPGLLILS